MHHGHPWPVLLPTNVLQGYTCKKPRPRVGKGLLAVLLLPGNRSNHCDGASEGHSSCPESRITPPQHMLQRPSHMLGILKVKFILCIFLEVLCLLSSDLCTQVFKHTI